MILATRDFPTWAIQNILVFHEHISLFQISGQSQPFSGIPNWINELSVKGLLDLRREREIEGGGDIPSQMVEGAEGQTQELLVTMS